MFLYKFTIPTASETEEVKQTTKHLINQKYAILAYFKNWPFSIIKLGYKNITLVIGGWTKSAEKPEITGM